MGRKSDRRGQILKEAVECAGAEGFFRTNARRVAERLGITPSNVFYYFPTQDQLFQEMLKLIVLANESYVRKFQDKAPRSTNRQRIDQYIDGNLTWAEKNPAHVGALIFGVLESRAVGQLSSLMRVALRSGEEKLYTWISMAVAEKEISGDLAPREVARALHQSLIGSIMHGYLFADGDYRKRMEGLVKLLIIPISKRQGSRRSTQGGRPTRKPPR